ncbi:MAG: C40 family peptidase [Chitinophagaceae bacterium]
MYTKSKLVLKEITTLVFVAIFFMQCADEKENSSSPIIQETVEASTLDNGNVATEPKPVFLPAKNIETGLTTPSELLDFAKSLIGVPYLYASTDPAKGFDCSGFVTYLFNHFNIAVPRSSVDFTNVGKEVIVENAQPGDLILFTGTDSTIRRVGHMGIIESNENGKIQFIHSTSGKLKGVVITPFERYYRSRFVKVIRVFPEHFFE